MKRWQVPELEYSHVLVGPSTAIPEGLKHPCRKCQRDVWLTAACQRWLDDYLATVWCVDCASALDEDDCDTVRLSPEETLLKIPETSHVPKAGYKHVKSGNPWARRRRKQ